MAKSVRHPSRRHVVSGLAAFAATPAFASNFSSFDPDSRWDADLEAKRNPVYFWHETALHLVALDHSIAATDARAPGPCASVRALALAQMVVADAVAASYAERTTVQFGPDYRSDLGEFAPFFVGGAAAAVLKYIYDTPAHAFLIDGARNRFLRGADRRAGDAWRDGIEFGRRAFYQAHWNWASIRDSLFRTPTTYIPEPQKHNVDPYNADQGFYGVDWGTYPPLVLTPAEQRQLTIDDPPDIRSSVYKVALKEVMDLGSYGGQGATRSQYVGLFYAYDSSRLIGTPPRLFNQILRQVLIQDRVPIGVAAQTLAFCNLAAADASQACWAAKYKYAVWRPIYGIRSDRGYGLKDWKPVGSPRTNPIEFSTGVDRNQRIIVQHRMGASSLGAFGNGSRDYKFACFTPNFPSYPSGHSTLCAAYLTMLALLRRRWTQRDPWILDPPIECVSDELNGTSIDNFRNVSRPYWPIRYRDLRQIIQDNDRSRVLLGVHWNFDTTSGAELGRQVAHVLHRRFVPQR